MSVQLSYKEGVLTARLSGEIDHHSAREMREAIDDTAQKVKPYCLVRLSCGAKRPSPFPSVMPCA